jgi:nitroreductase
MFDRTRIPVLGLIENMSFFVCSDCCAEHDVGHAIACITVAAAGLGWEARLLENVVDDDLAALFSIHLQVGVEAEHADCVLAVFPQLPYTKAEMQQNFKIETDLVSTLRTSLWMGSKNTLSQGHHDWPVIDEVAATTQKHVPPGDDSLELGQSPLTLRKVIYQRRSAVEFDGRTRIKREAFYQIPLKAMPGAKQIPFTTPPWRPCVDLLLFVHRVEGLPSGLYVLLRDPARKDVLRRSMKQGFLWRTPDGYPNSLPLFFLMEGGVRDLAQQTSCNQAIAADGAFAVAMLTEYREPLESFGPWFYRRFYWETGGVGQVLYLEAEAAEIRGTGIGCFFDELSYNVFGLEGDSFQVLYHFTMGDAVDDSRLQTHPPYQHLSCDPEAIKTSMEH